MTSTRCLRCEADAQQFLCRECIRRARTTLHGLPRLMRHLAEAAVGQTRLGDIGRHAPYRSRHELDGESELASHIEPLPEGETDLDEARRVRERAALRKLLAAGGVNERASTLYVTMVNMLTTWIRDICEIRGVDPGLIAVEPAALCAWLSRHVDAIANHPAADEFCDELDERVHQLLRIINRPQPHLYCGPCPTELTDGYGMRVCSRELTARRGAVEIQCPACRTTHNVDKLCAAQLDNTDDKSFTIAELSESILPAVREYVPLRTLQHWAATGKLVPTGWGRDAEPRFMLGDVRRLREEKPQTRPTGAAAHEK